MCTRSQPPSNSLRWARRFRECRLWGLGFTRQGPLVRSQYRPPFSTKTSRESLSLYFSHLGRLAIWVRAGGLLSGFAESREERDWEFRFSFAFQVSETLFHAWCQTSCAAFYGTLAPDNLTNEMPKEFDKPMRRRRSLRAGRRPAATEWVSIRFLLISSRAPPKRLFPLR